MQNQACGTKTSPVQSRVGGWVGGHCRQKKKEKRLDPLHNTLNSSLSKGWGGGGGWRKVILFLPWTQPQITISKAETGTEKKKVIPFLSQAQKWSQFSFQRQIGNRKDLVFFPLKFRVASHVSKGDGGKRKEKKGKRKMIHTAASHNSGIKKKKEKRTEKQFSFGLKHRNESHLTF